MPHPLDQVPPAARAKLEALIAKLPAGLTVGSVVHTPHGWGVTLLDEHGEVAAQVGMLDEEEEEGRQSHMRGSVDLPGSLRLR